jgi:hypothetical protein
MLSISALERLGGRSETRKHHIASRLTQITRGVVQVTFEPDCTMWHDEHEDEESKGHIYAALIGDETPDGRDVMHITLDDRDPTHLAAQLAEGLRKAAENCIAAAEALKEVAEFDSWHVTREADEAKHRKPGRRVRAAVKAR